jgi:hypothetical protein
MIPYAEIAALMLTVADAMDRANAGAVTDGYMILLSGLERAAAACDAGAPWGEDLRKRYQTAAEDFASQYGIGRA